MSKDIFDQFKNGEKLLQEIIDKAHEFKAGNELREVSLPIPLNLEVLGMKVHVTFTVKDL